MFQRLRRAPEEASYQDSAFLHSYSKKGGWPVSAAVDTKADPPDRSTAARPGQRGGVGVGA